MLKKSLRKVLSASQEHGWVMEPECKQILKDIGISVPKFRVVTEWEEALGAADDIGYPLVCKVVSPAVIHKSDSGGVMVGIDTGVEIYQDTSIRMAPITSKNIESMLRGLKAYQLLEGYRGSTPVNLKRIKDLLLSFSDLVLELEDVFESIDLNPVMCSQQACVVADARIMLNSSKR